MIEDKKIGLKIAENKEEQLLIKLKKGLEVENEKLKEDMKMNPIIIDLNNDIIKMCEKKLKGRKGWIKKKNSYVN